MKALTVRQPHAQLIALGVKTIETRTKPTKFRGPLLIHAGTAQPKEGAYGAYTAHSDQRRRLYPGETRRFGLYEAGLNRGVDLPLGAIIASCKLVDCVPIVPTGEEAAIRTVDNDDNRSLWLVEAATDYQQEWGEFDQKEITDQKPYGDFTPGRYAWLLEDIKPVEQRCPACWGAGARAGIPSHQLTAGDSFSAPPCPICHSKRTCDPIPAKGKLGLWEWTP